VPIARTHVLEGRYDVLPQGGLAMQKRFTVCILTMLSITCGAAVAAQLTPAQKIDRVTTLLLSLETRDPRPLTYIDSDHYTQHNLEVADGRAALKELVLHSPAGTAVHTVRIFADGDYVVAQTDYNFGDPKVGFDVFRFDRDKIVEHWGNLQDKCAAPNPSGRTQLDGPTKVTDVDKTDGNKLLMKGCFDDVVLGGQRDKVGGYRSAANFQHNCDGEDNKSGFQFTTGIFAKPGFVFKYTKVHKILGQGNFVLVMSEGLSMRSPRPSTISTGLRTASHSTTFASPPPAIRTR
jgi:predicted SnoaL-like aldol condensation-catalyzing enzyme